jgi:hypothetical protein
MPTTTRRGSAAFIVLLIVIVLVLAGVLGWILLAPKPAPAAAKAAASVIAVRQAENLPTYLQTGFHTGQGAAVGGKLLLVRDGKPVATLMIESCDAQGSTCRILPDSWAAGASTTVAEGERVEAP